MLDTILPYRSLCYWLSGTFYTSCVLLLPTSVGTKGKPEKFPSERIYVPLPKIGSSLQESWGANTTKLSVILVCIPSIVLRAQMVIEDSKVTLLDSRPTFVTLGLQHRFVQRNLTVVSRLTGRLEVQFINRNYLLSSGYVTRSVKSRWIQMQLLYVSFTEFLTSSKGNQKVWGFNLPYPLFSWFLGYSNFQLTGFLFYLFCVLWVKVRIDETIRVYFFMFSIISEQNLWSFVSWYKKYDPLLWSFISTKSTSSLLIIVLVIFNEDKVLRHRRQKCTFRVVPSKNTIRCIDLYLKVSRQGLRVGVVLRLRLVQDRE